MSAGTCLCRAGYYDDGLEDCLPCHFSCKNCNAGGDRNCTSCDINVNRYKSGSQCLCTARLFSAEGEVSCQACHYSCYTCLNATDCTGCDLDTDRRSQVGVRCPCVTGYYDNQVSSVCDSCADDPHYCNLCNDRSTCLTCLAGSNRQLTNGMCTCQDGFYQSGTNPTCQSCHYSCLTCGTAASNTCYSCDAALKRYFLLSSCPCRPGTYTATTCLDCWFECLTCSGPASNQCLSCDEGQLRLLAAGSCPCRYDYLYATVLTLGCKDCHYSCQKCSGPL
jgi:proprotein convertase subtilisin/kexin type 5